MCRLTAPYRFGLFFFYINPSARPKFIFLILLAAKKLIISIHVGHILTAVWRIFREVGA